MNAISFPSGFSIFNLAEVFTFSFWKSLFPQKNHQPSRATNSIDAIKAKLEEKIKILHTKIELVKSGSADFTTDPNYHRLFDERMDLLGWVKTSKGVWVGKPYKPISYELLTDAQKTSYDRYDKIFRDAIEKDHIAPRKK